MAPVEPSVDKPTSTDTAPAQATAKPSVKERFTVLFREYGPLAIGVYLAIFALSVAGFAVALSAGVDLQTLGQRVGVQLDGAGGTAGTLFIAWVLTKALQVPRIFATLVLTPLVGRIPFIARRLPGRGTTP
ncbi:FAM210A/B-like domain-containing protein [Hyalangium gracile]|uniref:FAM210A/B-like domain-containing protein n=1 Tax=Hyalangium gracile TaxID=394092 RepID=UPI001CC9A1A6|nr:DUF1279 domain-containing protein [Hyalangium gracile]